MRSAAKHLADAARRHATPNAHFGRTPKALAEVASGAAAQGVAP